MVCFLWNNCQKLVNSQQKQPHVKLSAIKKTHNLLGYKFLQYFREIGLTLSSHYAIAVLATVAK